MTAPKLATTRPAALTGRVGQGRRRPHPRRDPGQALLGQKRDKSSRPYLRKHLPGKYDIGAKASPTSRHQPRNSARPSVYTGV